MILILETKVGLQVARILFKSNIHVSVEKVMFIVSRGIPARLPGIPVSL